MAEILTESFCERCGTRYTFQTAAPKGRRGSKLKVLGKGVRNFVLNDETTLAEALADARSDVLRDVSSGQLDAFHQTFNFCMTCRQYTCSNCWNEVEGRCLTCAPHLGHEILPAPFPNLTVAGASDPLTGADSHPTNGTMGETESRVDAAAWPELDLRRPTQSEPAEAPAAEIEPPVEVEAIAPAADAEAEAEALIRAEAEAAEAAVMAEAEALAEAEAAAQAEVAAEAEAVAEGTEPVEAEAPVEAGAPVEAEAGRASAGFLAEVEPLAAAEPEPVAEEAISERVTEPEVAPPPAAEAAPPVVEPAPPVLRRIHIQPRVGRPMKPVPMEEWLEEPDPEPVAEIVAQSEPEPVTEREAEPIAQVVAEPDPEPVAEIVAQSEPVAEAVAEPEVIAEPEPEPVAEVVAQWEPEGLAEPPTAEPSMEPPAAGPLLRRLPRPTESIDERAAAAASQTADLLARFRPDQGLEEAIAEYEEHEAVAEAPAARPEPAWPVEAEMAIPVPAAEVEPEPGPEPVAAIEHEPLAPVQPEPEPVPAASEPAPEPVVPPQPRVDRVETPVWTTVAPESTPPTPAATPPAPEAPQPVWPTPQAQPQWPTAQAQQPGWSTPVEPPQWPSRDPSSTVPFLTDTRSAAEILWAASNQEVLNRPANQPVTGVQPCVSCGLSLSANARFCRRCGTRQG